MGGILCVRARSVPRMLCCRAPVPTLTPALTLALAPLALVPLQDRGRACGDRHGEVQEEEQERQQQEGSGETEAGGAA